MKWPFIPQNWQLFGKYRFLSLFIGTFLVILLISNPLLAFSPESLQAGQEIRGVWLTTNDTETLLDRSKLKKAVSQLAGVNFNTLYPVVWNSGYALYQSKVAQAAGIQAFIHEGLQGQDPLAELISEAHTQGLLVIPWFEFGFMAPPSSELSLKHPQWLTKKRDGSKTWVGVAGEVVWLNPFHPEVQQFITSLVLEVIDNYNVDGIQFDDHLSLPKEFGYDPYTISLYKQETGKNPPANPQDAAWVRWRADQLTAFVARLNQAIKARKPKAIFSISPNPYITAYNSYLQDWLAWVRQKLVDELIVQVYRPNLSSFLQEITRPEIQEAKQKIPTGVGILTGLRNRQTPMGFIQNKVLAARHHSLGVSFFFYDSLWNYAPEPPQERQSRFRELFPAPASRSIRDNSPVSNSPVSNSPVSVEQPLPLTNDEPPAFMEQPLPLTNDETLTWDQW